MSGARLTGAIPRAVLFATVAIAAGLALPALVPAQRDSPSAKEGSPITALLPEGQERSLAVRRFDGGEYVAAGDVAEVLRATSYWRSETRKLLLRIGEHRLTVTAGNPFAILDGNVTRWSASPRHADGQVWLPIAVFDLLATARVLPDIRWDSARRELVLSSTMPGREARAAARRAAEDSLRRAARGVSGPAAARDPRSGTRRGRCGERRGQRPAGEAPDARAGLPRAPASRGAERRAGGAGSRAGRAGGGPPPGGDRQQRPRRPAREHPLRSERHRQRAHPPRGAPRWGTGAVRGSGGSLARRGHCFRVTRGAPPRALGCGRVALRCRILRPCATNCATDYE